MASLDLEKRARTSISVEDDVVLPERPAARCRILPWLAAFALLLLFTFRVFSGWCPAATPSFTNHGAFRVNPAHPELTILKSRSPTLKAQETAATTTSAAAPARTVLKTFEVAQPILMPDGPAESDGSTRHGEDYSPELCTVLLMRHDFAFSYGAPFVGSYTPPSCEFNRVVLNFSVVSEGRQYDRLAIMYFGDTEVWRTSTAEPTVAPGISWIYLKDMTHYMSFWKSPQKIIFDLGNLINDRYTGIFNTTMTAIFYNSDAVTDQGPPSDLIIPISARQAANNSVSHFTLPAQDATNTINFPRNARRAVFSVSANGQASEEFWWSNVLQQDVNTFNATAGPLPGYSPFREVQVLIDGKLAGVQWPFPVIFTGGVVPSLHRPIVGIHAFDLREHEIDTTPFLPLLCDGAQHTFTIRVAGMNDTPLAITDSVNESWYVTGKVFVWLDDDPSSITTGDLPTLHPDSYSYGYARGGPITDKKTGQNETLYFTTDFKRTLHITNSRLVTQHTSSSASWKQTLSCINDATITAFGFNQVNDLLITGQDESSLSTPNNARYIYNYQYPLFANSSYSVSPEGGNLTIWAYLRQGKSLTVAGPSVFPSGLEAFPAQRQRGKGGHVARLNTTKEGTAEFRQSGDARESTGWGSARQEFWFGVRWEGEREEEVLYKRDVEAVNGSVVYDRKQMAGRDTVVGDGEEGGQGKVDAGAGAGVLVYAQVRVGEGKGVR